MIKAILRYLLSVTRHKVFVFWAGINYVKGIPVWRLLIHDISKYNPIEFYHYARYYWLPGGKETNKDDFITAWMHHQKRNKHHPEYWTTVGIFDWSNRSVDMPFVHVLEMVADLMGASREYEKSWDMTEWLKPNLNRWDYCTKTTCIRLAVALMNQGYPVDFDAKTKKLIWRAK